MKLKYASLFILLGLLAQSTAHSIDPEKVATFDRVVISPDELFYEEDKKISPDRTFILLRSFRPLSTPSGQRFALVTVQNQLNSRQSLTSGEFVGIFADGSRRYPGELSIRVDSQSTLTFVLNFGESHFPLVKVLVDNGKG